MSWQQVKIGSFLHRIKRPVKVDASKEYKLVTIRINHNGVSLRETKKGADLKSNMYEVKEGDFILSGIDARNGAFGIIPKELDGALVTNDFWYFEINESVIDKHFFLELTSTNWFDEICKRGSDGTTQRIRLQKDKFFNQSISLPNTIALQREMLLKITAIRHRQSILNEEIDIQKDYLAKLKKSILQDAICGKLTEDWRENNPNVEPASELLKRIKAEKQLLIKNGKIRKEKPLDPINESELPFAIPPTWQWCRLGEIASIVRGGSPRPAGDKRFYDGSIPFLKVGDLTGYEGIYCNQYIHTIKETGLYKTRYVQANTLMLTNSGATLGVPRICSFATTFNDGIAAFLNIDQVNIEFLYYILLSKSMWFLEMASRGQGQPNLNIDIISDTIIALPSIEEQKRIIEIIKNCLDKCREIEAQITESETLAIQLTKSILSETFSNN